ncbi:IclR family transcriptional regulator [Nocardioides alcanivorans]|uniref:IclR family transcriptional regulator n=1 Tax=Nocardioides alcanivorans TaxID=2897352 RepID=UPI001F176D44|nr:helix-turn-helix domain-containing protein [Nocardioides alcanivorans]
MIERITSVMDAIRAAEPINHERIAAATGLPQSTIFRLLSALMTNGWVAPHGDGRYCLGWRAERFAGAMPDVVEIRGAAAETLMELHWLTHGVAHLTVRDGWNVHYLDKVGGDALPTVPSVVGAKVPACSTVSGHSLLASMPPAWVADRHAARPCDVEEQQRLRESLARARRNHGVMMLPARLHPIGLTNAAAPVMGPGGAVAAVSVAVRSARAERLASLVAEAANRISEALFPAERQHPHRTAASISSAEPSVGARPATRADRHVCHARGSV